MSFLNLFNKKTDTISDNSNSYSQTDEILPPERTTKQPPFLPIDKDPIIATGYEAYYNNGVLYDVKPRNKNISLDENRQVAYDAQYIILNNIKYDLEKAESISSIVIPHYDKMSDSMVYTTMDLGYILKMRVGKEERPHLAVPLAYKTANIMLASPISWQKKDYYRLVIQLWSIGEIAYGDYLLEQLKNRIPTLMADDELRSMRKQRFEYSLSIAKQLNEDYLLISYPLCLCEKCAPFRGRVFNISGKDRRFPKLSEHILHPEDLCCVSFSSFFYYDGATIEKYYYDSDNNVEEKKVDAISYSNRPFIDDRSTIEKQNYAQWKERHEKKAENDKRYYDRQNWIEKYNCRFEYYEIKTKLSQKAPKSFNGYLKMKRSNSAAFQKLVKLAKEVGVSIS